ncbi:MAG: hypothetical protein IGBAC_2076 [Ignavibacteriae bacterium]|nr:MAG: hypothetical protein IGBAC_2076 [Ignavibacteriota bacterium]
MQSIATNFQTTRILKMGWDFLMIKPDYSRFGDTLMLRRMNL